MLNKLEIRVPEIIIKDQKKNYCSYRRSAYEEYNLFFPFHFFCHPIGDAVMKNKIFSVLVIMVFACVSILYGQGVDKNKIELNESSLATQYISAAYELFILKQRAALIDVNMSRLLRRFFHPKEFQDVRKDKIVIDLAQNVINIKRQHFYFLTVSFCFSNGWNYSNPNK